MFLNPLVLLTEDQAAGESVAHGDFPILASQVLTQLKSLKSDCLKLCLGGLDPSMAVLCLLVSKAKVKTAGDKRQEVQLPTESIVNSWRQTSKMHMISQILA